MVQPRLPRHPKPPPSLTVHRAGKFLLCIGGKLHFLQNVYSPSISEADAHAKMEHLKHVTRKLQEKGCLARITYHPPSGLTLEV